MNELLRSQPEFQALTSTVPLGSFHLLNLSWTGTGVVGRIPIANGALNNTYRHLKRRITFVDRTVIYDVYPEVSRIVLERYHGTFDCDCAFARGSYHAVAAERVVPGRGLKQNYVALVGVVL
jgi:hypothetical protein